MKTLSFKRTPLVNEVTYQTLQSEQRHHQYIASCHLYDMNKKPYLLYLIIDPFPS